MRRRYGLEMLNIQKLCNSCGAKFIIEHTLSYKKGGLVAGRHNKVDAKTGYITIQALGLNHVCDEPKIITYPNRPDT